MHLPHQPCLAENHVLALCATPANSCSAPSHKSPNRLQTPRSMDRFAVHSKRQLYRPGPA